MRGNPALTPAQIAHIRRLHKSGLNIHELARRFGVSRDVIDNLITGHIEYKPVKASMK